MTTVERAGLGSRRSSSGSSPAGERALEWLVRTGFVARAITYGLVGALALALALGAGTDHTAPNQKGALELIAHAPLGTAALVVIAAGFLSYALWKLMLAATGDGPEGGGDPKASERIANLGGGIVYLAFCAVAIGVLAGSSSGSSGSPKHAAAGILGWPGGQWIVAAAGVALIAIGGYQAYEAIRGRFTDRSKTNEMSRRERRTFMGIGRVGISARAFVFALIGYFVLRTAIDYQPSQAISLNDALDRLHHQALGPWLVGLVAVGLMTFAAFCLFEARYRRL
jgi:hypothetical protein